jgi:ubiquitin carboxyl-terminal hydrolase L3
VLSDPTSHLLPWSEVVYEPDSPITKFIDSCQGKRFNQQPPPIPINLGLLSPFADKTPLERAKFLESEDLFANIHAAPAASGQTAIPKDLDADLHFTCFIQTPEASARKEEIAKGGRRIKLDGGRAGPVDHGKSSMDLLKVHTLCWPGLPLI